MGERNEFKQIRRRFGPFEADGTIEATGIEGIVPNPGGVVIDGYGNWYVTDKKKSRVLVFRPNGKLIHSIGVPGQLLVPYTLTLDLEGNVVVMDARGVHKFCPQGRYLLAFGRTSPGGAELGQLSSPHAICTSVDGHLVISEVGNHRVQIFTPKGVGIRVMGSLEKGPTQLCNPGGVATDSHKNIFVVDRGNVRVVVFDWTGRPLRRIAYVGFIYPAEITVDRNGTILVSEVSCGKVHILDKEGLFLAQLDVTQSPGQMIIDPEGNILVLGQARLTGYSNQTA